MPSVTFKKAISFVLSGLIGIFIGACAYTWQAVPDPTRSLPHCDPYHGGVQMVQVPLLENTWQTVHDCTLHPPEKVAIAITVYYNNWRLKFGESPNILQSLNNLLIEWSPERKNVSGFGIHGNKFINSPVVGLARTPTMIWVQTDDDDRICSTAFVHELVHISIWALKGTDGDADHEGPLFQGWTPAHTVLIKETNAALCGLGI